MLAKFLRSQREGTNDGQQGALQLSFNRVKEEQTGLPMSPSGPSEHNAVGLETVMPVDEEPVTPAQNGQPTVGPVEANGYTAEGGGETPYIKST